MASTRRRVFKCLEWLPYSFTSPLDVGGGSALVWYPDQGYGRRSHRRRRWRWRWSWRCVCRALFSLSHFSSSPPVAQPTPSPKFLWLAVLGWMSVGSEALGPSLSFPVLAIALPLACTCASLRTGSCTSALHVRGRVRSWSLPGDTVIFGL